VRDQVQDLSHRTFLARVGTTCKIAGNPAEGIKALYPGDRSDIIWTATDITTIKVAASTEIAYAVDLAAHTGLRLGDLPTGQDMTANSLKLSDKAYQRGAMRNAPSRRITAPLR
jgi:hypothetical protein